MNNREIATVCLFGLFILLAMLYAPSRGQVPNLAKAFFKLKIIVPFATYAGGLALIVWLSSVIGLWRSDLLTDTIFWFFLSGAAWLFNINKAGRDPDFIWNGVKETVAVAAFFEFFINLEPLGLVAELFLQIFLIVIVVIGAVSAQKPESQKVARLANRLLALTALCMLAYTVWTIIADWGGQDWSLLWRKLLLPVWLTLVSAPFIYVIAYYAGWEVLLMRLRLMNERQRPKFGAIAGMAWELGGSLVDISAFAGRHAYETARVSSFKDGRLVVRKFRADRQSDIDRRMAARRTLADMAGVKGVDQAGRSLDRREFAGTKTALRYLATCHMGWYRHDDYYVKDLLTRLGSFERQGLPGKHDIQMHVSDDGQSWYAWRRTVTGYVFGIGAIGGPPSQWLYHGAKPPKRFPATQTGWSDDLKSKTPDEWQVEEPV